MTTWPPGHEPDEVYTVEIRRDSETGIAYTENWEMHGKNHRVDGPAKISRDRKTGTTTYEAWYLHGQLHREDGPAVIRRAVTGRITLHAWYVNNERIPAPKRRGVVVKAAVAPRPR
jgi:hypothetical protein